MRSKQPISGRSVGNKTRSQGVGNSTCVVKSTKTIPVGTASPAGVLYAGYTLDPSNTAIVTSPVAAIAGAYEFYRIRSATVEYIPSGGFTATGSFQWAYINNPELQYTIINGSDSARSDIISNEQNVTSGSIAAPCSKTYQNNRVQARKWYSTNTVLTAATISEYDRSVATVFAARVQATASTAVPGYFVFHITYEFSGLGTTVNYTLAATSGPRFTYDASLGWPSSLTLVSRGIGEQVYTTAPAGPGDGDPEPEP